MATVDCTRCGKPAEGATPVEVPVYLEGCREGTIVQVLCLECRSLPHVRGELHGIFVPARADGEGWPASET